MKTQRCILTKFTLQVFSSVANSKIRNQNIQCHRTGCSYLLNSNFHLEVFEIFTQNARLLFVHFFFKYVNDETYFCFSFGVSWPDVSDVHYGDDVHLLHDRHTFTVWCGLPNS